MIELRRVKVRDNVACHDMVADEHEEAQRKIYISKWLRIVSLQGNGDGMI